MHSRRRKGLAPLTALLALVALAAASLSQRDLVLFNHSPSMPVGLYLRIDHPIARGAIVTVRARDVAPEEARRRHFTDATDRFIKRVAAAAGDEVCGDGRRLSVGGRVVAERRESADIPLGWSGCRVLEASEILLLGERADSFDGRYWGPTNAVVIEGVWRRF